MDHTALPNVEIVRGAAAERLIGDASFVAEWRRLRAACPWATAFQGPDFVLTWYRTYRSRFEPVLAVSRADGGELRGLLTLAAATSDGRLAVAGTWHAEYQVWVCEPELAETFPAAALAALRRDLPSAGLRFTYVPPNTPLGWLSRRGDSFRCLSAAHRRPIMRLGDGSAVTESLNKSGNKSRLKRMKKLGPVEFRRVTDPAELAALFDDLVACYDARRMAVSGSAPFRNDSLKRPFHLAMAAAPGLIHATVLTIGPHLVAAHLGVPTGKELQLGLIAHNPLFAAHSPGKFQLLFLAQLLSAEGYERLDLTAGGDPYKERFADDWDGVHTLAVYPSRLAQARGWSAGLACSAARVAMKRLKFSRTSASVLRHRLARVRPRSAVAASASAVARAAEWVWSEREIRILSHVKPITVGNTATGEQAVAFRRDCVADLLDYDPRDGGPVAPEFMSDALVRLEAGQHAYTCVEGGRLVARGWLMERPDQELIDRVLPGFDFPAGSALVMDLHTSRAARGRGLATACLRAMIRDAWGMAGVETVVIAVPARNRAAIRVAEKCGFRVERSVRCTTRFGRVRSRIVALPEAPPVTSIGPTVLEPI